MTQRDQGEAVNESGGPAYDRRRFLRQAGLGVAGIAGAVLLDVGTSSASPFISRAVRGAATSPPKLPPGLLAAAKKEGTLNLIADPYNWANYGTQSTPNTVIGEFYKLYGINCPVVNPLGSSAQELTAILSFKGTPKDPDAVDVSPEIAEQGEAEKAFAPYKVQTWSEIPSDMKDPKGAWYGDYYGVTSFGTNTKVVKNPPKSWKDLLKPEYKGQVAIVNSPAVAGDAFAAVWSAALANGAALVVSTRERMAAVADVLAAEHLALHVADPEGMLGGIRRAGAAFLGPLTPEALGDYVAGPSHVLPTGGAVRFGSPLGVYDFVTRTSIIQYSAEALARHERAVCAFARLEGLEGHARAVEARVRSGG